VHYVPNGEIGVVTSSSRTFAYAVIDVTIALDQDIAPVIDIMRETGAQLRANSVFGPRILEDLDIAGIETWNDRGITLRARMKVRALEQSNVRREYLMRLKQAFDSADIQQPRSTVTIMERTVPTRAPVPEGPPQ
jgi:small conductance mechanosensitive channel